jgi:hypothetical protein
MDLKTYKIYNCFHNYRYSNNKELLIIARFTYFGIPHINFPESWRLREWIHAMRVECSTLHDSFECIRNNFLSNV